MKSSTKKVLAAIITCSMVFTFSSAIHSAHAEVVWDPNSGQAPYDPDNLSFEYFLNGAAVNAKADAEHQKTKKPFVDEEGHKHYYMLFGFKSSEKNKNWETAREKCIKDHGHLATITSKAELDYIDHNYLNAYAYIGLHRDQKGKWKWVTQEKYDSDDVTQWGWNNGEPNGGSKETVGELNPNRLNDTNYASTDSYICEWDQYSDLQEAFSDGNDMSHYTLMCGENDIRHIYSLDKHIRSYGLARDEDGTCSGMFTGYKYKMTYAFNNLPGGWTDDTSVLPKDKGEHVALNVYVKENKNGGIANMIFADQIINNDDDRDDLTKSPLYIIKILKKDTDDTETNVSKFLEKNASSSIATKFREMNQQILAKNAFYEYACGETSVETFTKRIQGYQQQALDDFFSEAAKRAKLLYGVDIDTKDLEEAVWNAVKDDSDVTDLTTKQQQAISSYLPSYGANGDYSMILKNCVSAEDASKSDKTFKDNETTGPLFLQLAGIFDNVSNYIMYNNSLQWYTTLISTNDESLSLYLDSICDFVNDLNYATKSSKKPEDKYINLVDHKEHTMKDGVCSYCGETQDEANDEGITPDQKDRAKEVKTAILKLPDIDSLKYDDKESVKTVAQNYDDLNVKQKAYIGEELSKKFSDLRDKMNQLIAEHNSELQKIVDEIVELPKPEEAQIKDLDDYSKAFSLYKTLDGEDRIYVSDEVQKKVGRMPTTYLQMGLDHIEEVQKEENRKKEQIKNIASNLETQIMLLPECDEVSTMSDSTLEYNYTKSTTLLESYNNLDDYGKSCISEYSATKIQSFVEKCKEVKKDREEQEKAAQEQLKKEEEEKKKAAEAQKAAQQKAQEEAQKKAQEETQKQVEADQKKDAEQSKTNVAATDQSSNADSSSEEDASDDEPEANQQSSTQMQTQLKKVTIKGKKKVTLKVKNAKWSSANSAIATVKNGKVTFKKKGTVAIKAVTGHNVYVYEVTYKPGVLKLNKKKVTLKKNKSIKIKVLKNTPKAKVYWSSSNKKIAKVKNGKITAVKKGKATITAKANDQAVKIKVTVK